MSLHLITYANAPFRANALGLVESAVRVGFKSARAWKPDDLAETDFYRNNQAILDSPRGAGFWLWKPYIILETLKQLQNDDCLLYCDAGRTSYYCFDSYPSRLEERVYQSQCGFLLGPAIPHLGNIQQWTKRDCLKLMRADAPSIFNQPLILTWSLWRRTETSITFLEAWLSACLDRRCLTDDPNVCGLANHKGFREHRHDQSIMSILAHKHGAPFLDFSRTLVHRIIEWRPGSALAHNFYKRPQNAEDLLAGDNPWLLVREFFRLRRAR